jgi:hypothetical protein
MKNKTIIGIISLSVGLVTYLLWNSGFKTPPATRTEKNEEKQVSKQKTTSDSASQADEPEFDYMSVLSEAEQAHVKSTGHVFTKEDIEKLKRKKLGKDIQELMTKKPEEWEAMLVTPVEFYGQVLDQFDQPVVGAKIRCSWAFMGSLDAAKELESDAYGKFEIVNMKAYSIGVSVYPPSGYDEEISDFKDVMIAKAPERVLTNENYKKFSPELKKSLEEKLGLEEAYKGDKTKPVIFRLKKL